MATTYSMVATYALVTTYSMETANSMVTTFSMGTTYLQYGSRGVKRRTEGRQHTIPPAHSHASFNYKAYHLLRYIASGDNWLLNLVPIIIKIITHMQLQYDEIPSYFASLRNYCY